ncbi:MAG: hypothetical protein RLY93_07090 [Sumerlaeia bacterium]
MNRDLPQDFHLPANLRYDCVRCGRGCTDFWEVPVDGASVERLRAFDLQAALPEDAPPGPAFADSPFTPGQTVIRRKGCECVFLTKDRLCALHSKHGPEAKPQNCLDFPFRYSETPSGVYVGLSFACTAVLQDEGRPVASADRRAELAANYRDSVHVRSDMDRPRLTRPLPIDFAAYAAIEDALDAIMAVAERPLTERLLAQSAFLDIVVRAFEAARDERAGASLNIGERDAARRATDEALAEALVARYGASGWEKCFALGARARSAPSLHRAFLGLMTTFRQALGRDASRARALWYILTRYAAHASRFGKIKLQPLEGRFGYGDFRRVHLDLSPGTYADRLLTRYFRHVLFRKDLLLSESVWAAHRFMLLHFALVRWYLVAHAINKGLDAPDEECVREAVRNVEQYFVHHSTFTRFFESQALLGLLLDTAIANPRYAGSMVHPPVT